MSSKVDVLLPVVVAILFMASKVMVALGDRIALKVELRNLNKLSAFCQEAPVRVEEQEVQQYTGTVVSRPSVLGQYGSEKPDDKLGEALFVLEDGADVPLMLLARLHEPPEPDTQLQFCAVTDDDGYWWPQTGYKAHGGKWSRGPMYGEPVGPFPTVKWIMDAGS